MNDEDQQSEVTSLPEPAHGAWRIQLHYLPVAYRGHAFLTLVDPEGTAHDQLHGVPESTNTGKVLSFGSDGSKLVTRSGRDYWMPSEETKKVGDVAAGTYDEIVRGK